MGNMKVCNMGTRDHHGGQRWANVSFDTGGSFGNFKHEQQLLGDIDLRCRQKPIHIASAEFLLLQGTKF